MKFLFHTLLSVVLLSGSAVANPLDCNNFLGPVFEVNEECECKYGLQSQRKTVLRYDTINGVGPSDGGQVAYQDRSYNGAFSDNTVTYEPLVYGSGELTDLECDGGSGFNSQFVGWLAGQLNNAPNTARRTNTESGPAFTFFFGQEETVDVVIFSVLAARGGGGVCVPSLFYINGESYEVDASTEEDLPGAATVQYEVFLNEPFKGRVIDLEIYLDTARLRPVDSSRTCIWEFVSEVEFYGCTDGITYCNSIETKKAAKSQKGTKAPKNRRLLN